MANYVSNRIICTKEFFEMYFLDFEPFGKDNVPDSPYITFHKLFGFDSYYDYDSQYSASIYNGYGFDWKELEDKRIEIKFCTRWEYPIEVIIKALELGKNQIEWFACEENYRYISKFLWITDGIEEQVFLLEDDYGDWYLKNEEYLDYIMGDRECDDAVWYYLPFCKHGWKKWPSKDIYSRYAGKHGVDIELHCSELEDEGRNRKAW